MSVELELENRSSVFTIDGVLEKWETDFPLEIAAMLDYNSGFLATTVNL